MPRYKCRNCHDIKELESANQQRPVCPGCEVERLTRLEPGECPRCANDEFLVYQPARAVEPVTTVNCIECGNRGDVDSDGVWW